MNRKKIGKNAVNEQKKGMKGNTSKRNGKGNVTNEKIN